MFSLHPFIMIMSLFHHQETSNPSKKCRFFKDALATCHTFCRKISSQSLQQDDDDDTDYDDEQEIFVSAVLSKYKESKSKRKSGLTIDTFTRGFDLDFNFGFGFGFSPTELPPSRKEPQHAYASNLKVEEKDDEFYSTCTHLSRCSSSITTTTAEAFMSVKTNLSRCSSMSSLEFPMFRRKRRSMFLELCRCEGWPFGLCRKALLVPPLPKSPSESWMWRKSTRLVKIH